MMARQQPDCIAKIDAKTSECVRQQVDMVTHALRNRLASLNLSVYLLERQSTDSSQLDRIKTQIAELNNLVNDLEHLSWQGTDNTDDMMPS